MANKLYREEDVRAVAEAIRAKNESTETYTLSEMPDAILAIESGSSVSAPLIVDSFGEEGLLGGKGRCTGITIGEGVTRIGQWAFEAYTALTSVTIPKGVTDIDSYAFYGCEALASVTFKGTPTIIQGDVFYECTNLTTINVPWAEGEVAGSPWSAENATINYNYTGE